MSSASAAHHRRRGRGRHRHAAHAVAQRVQDLVGGVAGAVDPVIEHHGPVVVIVGRLGRVLHDQRPVQAPVQLDADVRVVPVRARLGDRERIGQLPAGRDRRLRHAGHAVHVVADGHAVPVHGGLGRKLVHQQRLQDLALAHPDLRTRDLAAEAPRRDDRPAQVDMPGLRGHAGLHRAGGTAGRFGRGDLRAVRADQVTAGGQGGHEGWPGRAARRQRPLPPA